MTQKLNLNGFLSRFQSISADKVAFKIWNEHSQVLENIFYKEFFESIQRLYSALDGLTQPKVMVIGSKGLFSSAAILATWFKHGCYFPATPQIPSQRIEMMIRIFNPDMIFVEKMTDDLKNILVKYHDEKKTVVCKFKNFFLDKDLPISKIHFTDRSENLPAYVMATSGTSGIPKFVKIKDSQLSSYYENIMQLLPTEPVNGLIQNFEITFDPSIGDLLWGFSKQAYFLPLNSAQIRSLSVILRSETNLWWSSTPSYADWALSFIASDNGLQNCVSHSFFLGEKLFPATCESWKKVFKNTEIHNLYGPTEATISISYHTYSPIQDSNGPIPIGRIHSGHSFSLDENQILSISGPQVGSGYYLPVPEDKNFFMNNSQQPSYYTGDICEVQNENLIILGRLDSQIKIHGQRFELEEMENFLKVKKIEVVLYLAKNDFIVAASRDFSLTLEKLHSALKEQFAMIFFPKEIRHMGEFPLTPNQKIDRKKLAEIDQKT